MWWTTLQELRAFQAGSAQGRPKLLHLYCQSCLQVLDAISERMVVTVIISRCIWGRAQTNHSYRPLHVSGARTHQQALRSSGTQQRDLYHMHGNSLGCMQTDCSCTWVRNAQVCCILGKRQNKHTHTEKLRICSSVRMSFLAPHLCTTCWKTFAHLAHNGSNNSKTPGITRGSASFHHTPLLPLHTPYQSIPKLPTSL